jgi:predicted Zn-dependent protease
MKKMFLPLLAVLLLGACAGPVTMAPQGDRLAVRQETERQKELVYKRVIEDQDRLFNVSFPLMGANAGFCGTKTRPMTGMTAWNINSVGKGFHRAARAVYNVQERLAVQFVADNSPAARAGVRSGDFIVALNGQDIPLGENAIGSADSFLKQAGYHPVDMILERDGRTISTTVAPVEVCDYPVLIDNDSNDINAFADGRKIVVSKGILRFAENDNELALVVAHELGHLAMHHVDKMQQNAMAGAIGGFAIDSLLAASGVGGGAQFSRLGQEIGAGSYSVGFEQEADYVGMYFMERAGYRSRDVADFWRRMAAENPRGVSARTDHPTSPERFIAIERTHDEIAAKRARHMQLVPNLQGN